MDNIIDNTQNQAKPTLPHYKKRKRKILKIITIVFAFFIVANLLLLVYAGRLIKKFLPDIVKKESSGLYTAIFDDISFDISTFSLSLSGFKLLPDTAMYRPLLESGKLKSALYEIKFDYFAIRGINHYALLINNSLKIKEIYFEKPSVKLISVPDTLKVGQDKKYDAINLDLYPFILKYLNILRIKKVTVKDGQFNFYVEENMETGATRVKNISINLYDFDIDRNKAKQKNTNLFYSQNIEISIDNYNMVLGDSIHVVELKDLYISTLKKRLSAKNLKLTPTQQYAKSSDFRNKTMYDIQVPEVTFDGIDFQKAYLNRTVEIAELYLPNAQINVYGKPSNQSNNADTLQIANFDLYELIKKDLHTVKLDTLKLINTNFNWLNSFSDKNSLYTMGSLSIILENFLLDSLANTDTTKILYSKNIDLNIDDFKMKLIKNQHQLKVRNIKVSTFEKKILAVDVELSPISGVKFPIENIKSKLDIYVPRLELIDVNLKRLYNEKELPIRLLQSTKPMVNIITYSSENKQKNKKKINTDNLYEIMSDYLKKINIEEFKIEKGLFNIETYRDSQLIAFTNGRMFLNLYKFALDTATATGHDKLFYADDVVIDLQDFSMKLTKNPHVLEAKEIKISTIDTSFAAIDVLFYPQINNNTASYLNKNLIDLSIAKIEMNHADLHQAYFDKKLQISKFCIQKPIIRGVSLRKSFASPDSFLIDSIPVKKKHISVDSTSLAAFYDKFSDFIEVVDIDSFEISDGYSRWMLTDSINTPIITFQTNFDINLKAFKLDKNTLFRNFNDLYSSNWKFKLKNANLDIDDKNIKIALNSAQFNSYNQSLICDTLNIVKQKPDNKFPEFNITIPKTKIMNPEIIAEGSKTTLIIDKINFNKPQIILTKNINSNDSLPTKQKQIKANSFFFVHQIYINDLLISHGKEYNKKRIEDFRARFDVQLTNLEQVDPTDKAIPFNFSNLKLHSNDFTFLLKDSIHHLRISELSYDTDNELQAKGFCVEPRYARHSDLLYELNNYYRKGAFVIRAPQIEVAGIDVKKYLYEKKLDVGSVKLLSPSMKIDNYYNLENKSNIKKNGFEIFLNKFNEKFSNVNINYLSFFKGEFAITNHLEEGDKSFRFENLSGELKKVHSRNKKDSAGYALKADDIHFRLNNYKYDIPNSIYSFSANEIGLSTSQSKIWFNDVKYLPYKEMHALAGELDFQTALMEIHGEQILINNVDMPALINKKAFIAQKIEFNNFVLDSYKNRKFPYNYLKRPGIPTETLRDAKNYIKIDTLNILNSTFAYEELAPRGNKPGMMFVDKININMFDITNDSTILKGNNAIKASASGYIMGESLASANFKFFPGTANQNFEINGIIDTTQIRIFNPMVENLLFVSLKDGVVKKCTFNITGDKNIATGDMDLYYNDVKFRFLDKDSLQRKKGVASFFANSIIRNNNPRTKFLPPRKGKIYYERNESKPIFHLWTSAVMSGMKSSLGFNSEQIKDEIHREKEERRQKEKQMRIQMRQQNRQNRIEDKQLKKQQKISQQ
jgi:hypothetical protein